MLHGLGKNLTLAPNCEAMARLPEVNTTGSGLGLYITQGIVQAHGGKIVAESEVGRGSEFRFTVPKVIEGTHT